MNVKGRPATHRLVTPCCLSFLRCRPTCSALDVHWVERRIVREGQCRDAVIEESRKSATFIGQCSAVYQRNSRLVMSDARGWSVDHNGYPLNRTGSEATIVQGFVHRVGGSLAAPVLPHHRTYGSVYGGSQSTLEPSPLILQRQQSAAIKVGLGEGRVHVRGPGIPPRPSPIHR